MLTFFIAVTNQASNWEQNLVFAYLWLFKWFDRIVTWERLAAVAMLSIGVSYQTSPARGAAPYVEKWMGITPPAYAFVLSFFAGMLFFASLERKVFLFWFLTLPFLFHIGFVSRVALSEPANSTGWLPAIIYTCLFIAFLKGLAVRETLSGIKDGGIIIAGATANTPLNVDSLVKEVLKT